MKTNNKSIKINPYIAISLLLFSILIFIISNRIVFIVNNVEKILIDPKTNSQSQKKFNTAEFNDLKVKMPID